MANVLAELFQNTADAIREKTGETGTMKPAEFPDKIREISVGASIDGQTVHKLTFLNHDGSELYSRYVFDGDDCDDPIARGQMTAPTKESTVAKTYAYSGWGLTADGAVDADALTEITADKSLYAIFAESPRYYTARFFDGETVLKTESVAYGETASPPSTEKEGYAFDGWTPSNLKIYKDTDFVGAWTETLQLEGYTWEAIAAISESGLASSTFSIGDTKTMTFTNPSGTDETIVFEIVGFDHDDLADGSGKAGITFMSQSVHATGFYGYDGMFSSTAFCTWSSTSCAMRQYCEALKESFPCSQYIKTVTKKTYKFFPSSSTGWLTTSDDVWIPSATEIGGNGLSFTADNQGEQYAYFADGGSKIKKLNGVTKHWCLRSRGNGYQWQANYVTSSGAVANCTLSSSYIYPAVGFCI